MCVCDVCAWDDFRKLHYFPKKRKEKRIQTYFLCDNQKEKSMTWKCFVFSAVKLVRREVYFRDKGEKKKKKTHLLSKDFSLFQGFFVSLLLYIMQYFVVKIDITWFLPDEFSYLMTGALFCI